MGKKRAHAVGAEVTDVVSADKHCDHFPVVVKINALQRFKKCIISVYKVVNIRNRLRCFYGNSSLTYRGAFHFVHKGAHLLQHVSAEESFWRYFKRLNALKMEEEKQITDPLLAPGTA